MNVIRWIIWAAVFLLILLLAFDNAGNTTLKFFGFASIQLPLILVLFITFALGVTCGLIASSLNVVRARREMKKAQKELKKREKYEKEHAVSYTADSAAPVEKADHPPIEAIIAEPVEATDVVDEAKPDKSH